MTIKIRPIHKHEIDFVNERYKEINFKLSDPDKEYIIVAELEGRIAGQGRIVHLNSSESELGGIYVYPEFRGKGIAEKIVGHLVEYSKITKRVYCLPFEHLATFYKSFGFKECTEKINFEIRQKYEWCLKSYPARTLLLSLDNN